jgi:hypothetical protein
MAQPSDVHESGGTPLLRLVLTVLRGNHGFILLTLGPIDSIVARMCCFVARLSWLGAAIVALMVASLVAASPAAAEAKTVSGELVCAPFQWVERIWFLGSESGWHGRNVPKAELPSTFYDAKKRIKTPAKYKFTGVKGELVKVWIECHDMTQRYSEFRLTSGTRHVCSFYGRSPCGPVSWGECATKFVLFNKNPISLLACLLKG